MPTSDQIARSDLQKKMALESELNKTLLALNTRIAKDFIRGVDSGNIILAESYRDDLEAILLAHYAETGEVFSTRIRGDLPAEIAITDDEIVIIASALSLYYLTRSGSQAEIITRTNQRDIILSFEFGIDATQRAAADGVMISQRERAVISGASLSNRLRARVGTISNTETQNAAETAKQTEAEVLSGSTPSITGGTPRVSVVNKEWITAGDERVRRSPFSHVAADSQSVSLSEPFVVGGQLLRWPGDTELGAGNANIINCRCGSVENRDQIISARFDTRRDIEEQVASFN